MSQADDNTQSAAALVMVSTRLPRDTVALLHAVAAAEDRTHQAVLRRALVAYADASPEYQARRAAAEGKV